jgi:hypothetical protein
LGWGSARQPHQKSCRDARHHGYPEDCRRGEDAEDSSSHAHEDILPQTRIRAARRPRRHVLRLDFLIDRGLELVGEEASRTRCAGVGDPAVLPDEEEAVRPRRPLRPDGVVDAVDDGLDALEAESCDAGARAREALGVRLRIIEQPVAWNRNRSGAAFRVGFADVDEQELDLLAVRVVQRAQPTGCFAEGRSGVGAEDERDRLLLAKRREHDRLAAVFRLEREVGRDGLDPGRVAAAFRPGASRTRLLPEDRTEHERREEQPYDRAFHYGVIVIATGVDMNAGEVVVRNAK